MSENIKSLFQKIAADEALQAKFKAVKNADEAYALAASIQSGFTKEEFVAAMTEVKAKMSRDVSDDDLEKAAGGVVVSVNSVTPNGVTQKTWTVTCDIATAAI